MARKKRRSKDDGEVIIELEPTLGIADAERLYERLVAVLADKGEVVFDASKIEAVDTAILQLLVAFIQETRNNNIVSHWRSPSEALRRTAGLLDLDGYLGWKPVDEGVRA